MKIYYVAFMYSEALQGVHREARAGLKLVLYDPEYTDKSTVKFKKPKK